MTDREAIDYLIAELQIRGKMKDKDYADAIMLAIRALNAACKPSNRPVDERNDGEPINVSTEGKDSGKWEVEVEKDKTFLYHYRFETMQEAEAWSDSVMKKVSGVTAVTIRRLEW